MFGLISYIHYNPFKSLPNAPGKFIQQLDHYNQLPECRICIGKRGIYIVHIHVHVGWAWVQLCKASETSRMRTPTTVQPACRGQTRVRLTGHIAIKFDREAY